MNQTNSLYKNIGILLGVVAVIGVFVVTFTQEKPLVKTSADASNSTLQNTDTSNTSNQGGDDSNVQANNTVTNTNPAPTKNPTATPAPVTADKRYTYKNGTYSAQGPYGTPEGQVAINVTLTITNDVITNANVVSVSGDRTTQRYQSKFISGYKQYVIGKSVDSVQLSNVSGSSLTPDGFNTALDAIKAQARA